MDTAKTTLIFGKAFRSFLLWGLINTFVFSVGCAPKTNELPLRVVSSIPENEGSIRIGEPIKIRFNRYLDPSTVVSSVGVLSSGEVELGMRVGYDPVERSLLIRPRYPLRPNLGYTVRLETDRLKSVLGVPTNEPFELNFVAHPGKQLPEEDSREEVEARVRDIFLKQCDECHGAEPAAFPELRDDRLVGQRSARQPEFFLVHPGKPLKSYLVLRMLDAYPGILGETKSLEPDDVRTVIDWIAHMANDDG